MLIYIDRKNLNQQFYDDKNVRRINSLRKIVTASCRCIPRVCRHDALLSSCCFFTNYVEKTKPFTSELLPLRLPPLKCQKGHFRFVNQPTQNCWLIDVKFLRSSPPIRSRDVNQSGRVSDVIAEWLRHIYLFIDTVNSDGRLWSF